MKKIKKRYDNIKLFKWAVPTIEKDGTPELAKGLVDAAKRRGMSYQEIGGLALVMLAQARLEYEGEQ